MVRNSYYIVLNAVLFFIFTQIMGALNSFDPDLRAERTFDDFIPSLVGGTLVINVICFITCFFIGYQEVFVHKKTILHKLLLFVAVEAALVLSYLYVIENVYLIQ